LLLLFKPSTKLALDTCQVTGKGKKIIVYRKVFATVVWQLAAVPLVVLNTYLKMYWNATWRDSISHASDERH